MTSLFVVLVPFQLFFLAYIIIWGCAFGFRNTWLRIKCVFTGATFLQSDFGKFCDGCFYFSILVLIILNN